MKNPNSGVMPEMPVAFNLMFQTAIGPSGNSAGYLRPETAQGQFLNFAKLLDWNQGQMPFASASVGKSFRNEISPRAGLLRVREFLMAEIEHYVDPHGGKKHARFQEVKHVELVLLNKETQLSGKTDVNKMSIGEAVEKKIVDNETLGYFLARIQLFLKRIGVDQSKIRFRQHMANEMAHYACDCWDAELLTSYGWIECVGCADRSAYDLTVHAKRTGAPLIVREKLEKPVEIDEWVAEVDKKKFGPFFKKDGKAIETAIVEAAQSQKQIWAQDLALDGKVTVEVAGVGAGKFEVTKDLLVVERRKRVEHVREYTPNVIEPSFGIGRILYSLLEHNYWTRGGEGAADEARGVLSFPPPVAPTKVLLVPLSNNELFAPVIKNLSLKLRQAGISSRIDDSGASIGRRYARNDELGTPLGVTADFQSLKDNTFTLRDRDSMKQVRADYDSIVKAIRELVSGEKVWADIEKELPAFVGQEAEVPIREQK
jgi:glycyl-tRNA synthetase